MPNCTAAIMAGFMESTCISGRAIEVGSTTVMVDGSPGGIDAASVAAIAGSLEKTETRPAVALLKKSPIFFVLLSCSVANVVN